MTIAFPYLVYISNCKSPPVVLFSAWCYKNERAQHLRHWNQGSTLTYVQREIVTTGSHVTWLRNSYVGWWRKLIQKQAKNLLQGDYLSIPITLQKNRHALIQYTCMPYSGLHRSHHSAPNQNCQLLPGIASSIPTRKLVRLRLRDEPCVTKTNNFHILPWQLVTDVPVYWNTQMKVEETVTVIRATANEKQNLGVISKIWRCNTN